MRSADSVVGIPTLLRVIRSVVRIRVGVSSSRTSKPALSLLFNGIQWVLGLFPWLNRPGYEVNYWPASSSEVKNEWSYTSTSLYFKFHRQSSDSWFPWRVSIYPLSNLQLHKMYRYNRQDFVLWRSFISAGKHKSTKYGCSKRVNQERSSIAIFSRWTSFHGDRGSCTMLVRTGVTAFGVVVLKILIFVVTAVRSASSVELIALVNLVVFGRTHKTVTHFNACETTRWTMHFLSFSLS
jgi:hypothetical protein